MKLSQKDLIKLGRYEASKGYSLNKIEADFLKKGIKRSDAIKALDVVDYYNKREKSKAGKEAPKGQEDKKAVSQKKQPFWPWLVLVVLIGIILYLYFAGMISFEWLRSINFK